MMKRKHLIALILVATIFVNLGPTLAGAADEPRAKYVFLFIGDGMGLAQRNAAELYLAKEKGLARPEMARLLMNTFPVHGMDTTYDLTSVIPDSSSTATAMSTGHKTKSGVVGMDADGKNAYVNIAELAKKNNRKVGIVTSVSLDHATPAAFYAHVPSRKNMYDISMQLAASGFDYFAGGQLLEPTDKKDPAKPNALEIARKNGYKVVMDRAGFAALRPEDGKVIAMNALVDADAAMYYTLDQKNGDHVTLTEFVEKGAELLDNPNGFFMMVEGGKIDWACHANDAAAAIGDVLALDAAVAQAVKFQEKHPGETLIVVTGDHETGGLTIGFAGTQYSSFVDKIGNQKMSYIEFGKKLDEFKKNHPAADARLEDVLPLIKEAFGLYVMPAEEKAALEKAVADGKVQEASPEAKKAAQAAEKELKYGLALSDREIGVLREAFQQSMIGKKERATDDYTYLLYGGYEPLAVKLTTILNNKAGIGWTSYSHTGVPVLTSAKGPGAELFYGYYDQTDVHAKLMKAAGFPM